MQLKLVAFFASTLFLYYYASNYFSETLLRHHVPDGSFTSNLATHVTNSWNIGMEVNGNVMEIADDPSENFDEGTMKETLPKVIVLRNGTSGLEWIPFGEETFKNCPNITQDTMCAYYPSSNPNEIYSAEAVIYRAFNADGSSYSPEKRNINQKWIFYENEPPFRTWNKYRYFNMTIWDKMNVTVHYGPSADIEFSMYGAYCEKLDIPPTSANETNFANGKQNAALWIVSNCLSSGRMTYVKELQKYFPVEILGVCGPKHEETCGHFATDRQCEEKIMAKYKFYLSLENAYCDNYYTEKLVKTAQLPIIPVVLGHYDYTQIVPKDSYIDIRDFPSPQKLGEFLTQVSKNDSEFNKYILAKKQYKCYRKYDNNMLCGLCEYLHQHRGQIQMAPDMRKAWGIKENCMKPKDFFKGLLPDETLNKLEISRVYKMVGMD